MFMVMVGISLGSLELMVKISYGVLLVLGVFGFWVKISYGVLW